ncbi:MAG TPA: sigma-70 family RNA polymerase sigma factor [Actinomycetota bacterium]|jgi:RNA polymerase sigma factor (sigma-70 family)|nr:sigma-70 family RNA polymerase sigma factor [Actinomycetota bacterium]
MTGIADVHPAFRALYEREFPSVFRAAFLLSGDRPLAEEATQEAFARALTRWGRIGSQPWVAGWVTTTAMNVARRQLRRRPEPTLDVAPLPDHVEALNVRSAVRNLPVRQQEAVVLHYLLDLPVAETAATMGCDEGTVKTHLSRARFALGRALTLDEGSEPRRRSDHG